METESSLTEHDRTSADLDPDKTYDSELTSDIMDSHSLVDLIMNIADDGTVSVQQDLSSVENVIKSSHKEWLEATATCLSTDGLVMKAFAAKLTKLIHISDPPCFNNREHHDYEHADFVNVADKTEILLSFFTAFIRRYLDIDRAQFIRYVIICTGVGDLLFLVVSNMKNEMWTNLNCNQLAVQVSDCLNVIYQCKSCEDLLLANSYHDQNDLSSCDIKNTIFSLILDKIQPRLTKTNWKENPVHVSVFLSCLAYVKHPYLSDYLDRVLPTSLLLVDDYMRYYKISGLQALQHIIDNVTATELKWQGRADVIYDAVKQTLYTNEIAVISASYTCMLAILNKVETLGKACSSLRKPGHYDEVLSMIMYNAEIENNLALRHVYTQHLPALIDKMSVSVVRHSSRLLRLVESYLQISDGDEEIARINALIILKTFIIQAWPRVASHKDHILKVLLRLVYDVTCDVSCDQESVPHQCNIRDRLLDHVESCLVLLTKCCGAKEVQTCLENVNCSVFTQLPASREFIDKVLMAIS